MSIHPATRQLIKLTTHPDQFGVDPEPLSWDARDPAKRGPVVATVSKPGKRNAIGAHSGTYSVYRAVALAAQAASAALDALPLPNNAVCVREIRSERGKFRSINQRREASDSRLSVIFLPAIRTRFP